MSRDTLPDGFFEWLSPKKKALIQVLLEEDGKWVHGDDLRERMRTDHNLSVPDKPGAISSHQGHLTKRYSKGFSRDVIDVQWVDETQTHAKYRVGGKYKDELRERLGR